MSRRPDPAEASARLDSSDASPGSSRFRNLRKWGALAGAVALALVLLAYFAVSTWETRKAVRTYTQLTVAVNAQDLEALRKLCTRRYLGVHALKKAPEGGVIGFPRTIHKNFQAWREDDAVWVCPTNRIGPLYQFVLEDEVWKYDGVIGLLRSGRQILVLTEEARSSEDAADLVMP